MYEFPASPAVGDVANGYRFDGTGWGGGPAVPTPTEQLFDLSGKASFDVAVPAWATGVEIIGSVFTVTSFGMGVQVSLDGSTFLATNGQYVYGGSALSSGTVAHTPVPSNNYTALMLCFSGDASNNTMPMLFSAELNLTRPNTTALFTAKTYGKSYDSSATLNYRTTFGHAYVTSAAAGSNLAIKALRFIPGGSTMAAGSWVKVRWLGDQVPQANGLVPEAAMDGRSYERRMGLWVPASPYLISSYTFAGKLTIDIPLPDGPKEFQIRYRNVLSAATSAQYLWVFMSMDGTTFNKTDGAYNWRALYTAGTGVAAAQWVSGAGSALGVVLMPLTVPNGAGYQARGQMDFHPGDAANINILAMNTQTFASQGMYTQVGAGYYGATGRVKALRMQTGIAAGEAFARGDLDLYGIG